MKPTRYLRFERVFDEKANAFSNIPVYSEMIDRHIVIDDDLTTMVAAGVSPVEMPLQSYSPMSVLHSISVQQSN